MISVVIPLYNKEKQIAKTLQSVFAQSYTDYEIVIVNDGSTDRSVEVIEAINDPRIRLIHQANAGVSAARNRGIEEAKGDYIAFLDADDEWKPSYLETIAKLIKIYPQCDVFATNYEFKKADDSISSTILNKMPFDSSYGILSNYFEVGACSNPPLWTGAVCASKKALKSVAGFPLGVSSGEDLLTWAKLASRYKIAYSRKPLAIFVTDSGYERSNKPKRVPAERDVVAEELRKLKKKFNPPYISQYISFWHKMRSVIFLRLNMNKASLAEAAKAIRYNPANVKAWALMILNFVPAKIRRF